MNINELNEIVGAYEMVKNFVDNDNNSALIMKNTINDNIKKGKEIAKEITDWCNQHWNLFYNFELDDEYRWSSFKVTDNSRIHSFGLDVNIHTFYGFILHINWKDNFNEKLKTMTFIDKVRMCDSDKKKYGLDKFDPYILNNSDESPDMLIKKVEQSKLFLKYWSAMGEILKEWLMWLYTEQTKRVNKVANTINDCSKPSKKVTIAYQVEVFE